MWALTQGKSVTHQKGKIRFKKMILIDLSSSINRNNTILKNYIIHPKYASGAKSINIEHKRKS